MDLKFETNHRASNAKIPYHISARSCRWIPITFEAFGGREDLMNTIMVTSFMLFVMISSAVAHQPFFEKEDITAEEPWHIADPTISTAIYASLETPDDVDYYSFNASHGQSILISITIPQIEGQESFAPTMALMGRGLVTTKTAARLPPNVVKPEGFSALILPPPANTTTFFEPFSRTSYWNRQKEYVKIPSDGRYVVAVWDDTGKIGRYVFVIGDREVPGGDIAFPLKMRSYWRPVENRTMNLSLEEKSSKPLPQPGMSATVSSICMTIAFIMLRRKNKELND